MPYNGHMDLTQLRLFLAVAEELNFRRAAQRCSIAQPALSRHIQRLEAELGVQLFRRTKRSVELTPMGHHFRVAVRAGVAHLDRGIAEVRRYGDVQATVRVGAVEYANFAFLTEVLRRFHAQHPTVRITRHDLPPAAQERALREGALDLAFHAVPHKQPELAYEPVLPTAWCIAVPAAHPLGIKSTVAVTDLAGEALILFPAAVNPELYRWIQQCLQQAELTPAMVHEPAQLVTALSMVAAGLGVFPTPFHLSAVAREDVMVRPLRGFDRGLWIRAVYRRTDESLLVRALLETVREVTAPLRE